MNIVACRQLINNLIDRKQNTIEAFDQLMNVTITFTKSMAKRADAAVYQQKSYQDPWAELGEEFQEFIGKQIPIFSEEFAWVYLDHPNPNNIDYGIKEIREIFKSHESIQHDYNDHEPDLTGFSKHEIATLQSLFQNRANALTNDLRKIHCRILRMKNIDIWIKKDPLLGFGQERINFFSKEWLIPNVGNLATDLLNSIEKVLDLTKPNDNEPKIKTLWSSSENPNISVKIPVIS